MPPFKKPNSIVKLPSLKRSPSLEDLVSAMRVAQQKTSSTVSQPWLDDGGSAYSVSVSFPDKGGEPRWVLHAGHNNRVVAAHATGDVALVHNLIVSHCGGTPQDAVDDLQFKSGTRNPKSASVAPASTPAADERGATGWTKLRNKALSDTSQRVAVPEEPYDPHEAERLRVLDKQKSERGNLDQEPTQSANLLIGDVLVAAGIIQREDLLRLMPVCKQTSLPIGRVLVESSLVTESIVRAAVTAQSLIRDKQLHFQLAVSAIRLCMEKDMTFEAALTERGWYPSYYEITNRLGQLLLDAGALTADQLHEATEVSFASGLPLGRVLVLRKMVPELVAYVALSVQVLLREDKISREEATKSIFNAASMGTTVHEWLQQDGRLKGAKENTVRLGELLILAGIISEIDLLSAVESSLTRKEQIGRILVETGVLSESVLEHALKMQKAVNSQLMSINEAARMVRDLHTASRNGKSGVEATSDLVDEELGKVIRAFGASDSADLKTVLQTLLQQKENLAFRLISEQEELKHRLARELNDTIVAELQMLKRYLAGDDKMSTEQSIEIVDNIMLQMGEICNDFVPKQLHERGLEQAVQDVVARVGKRSGMYCDTQCPSKVMVLPQPVQLHVFRILQDWINVIEKYARASKLSVKLEQVDDVTLRVTVTDNGKGSSKAVDPRVNGIKGLQNLQERLELIRCYYDTKIDIQAKPGASKIELEIVGKRA
ncbi:MAG TPA: hypothetical protein V6C86_26375 [Oculatellaceae cyanobacterium]